MRKIDIEDLKEQLFGSKEEPILYLTAEQKEAILNDEEVASTIGEIITMHRSAMTKENLHSKTDIAFELARRDLALFIMADACEQAVEVARAQEKVNYISSLLEEMKEAPRD